MKKIILMLAVLSVLIVGCGTQNTQVESCMHPGSGSALTLSEAKEIAIASECGSRLKSTALCNESTGTWWIDLNVMKTGCNPACVVDIVGKQANINWGCPGALV